MSSFGKSLLSSAALSSDALETSEGLSPIDASHSRDTFWLLHCTLSFCSTESGWSSSRPDPPGWCQKDYLGQHVRWCGLSPKAWMMAWVLSTSPMKLSTTSDALVARPRLTMETSGPAVEPHMALASRTIGRIRNAAPQTSTSTGQKDRETERQTQRHREPPHRCSTRLSPTCPAHHCVRGLLIHVELEPPKLDLIVPQMHRQSTVP